LKKIEPLVSKGAKLKENDKAVQSSSASKFVPSKLSKKVEREEGEEEEEEEEEAPPKKTSLPSTSKVGSKKAEILPKTISKKSQNWDEEEEEEKDVGVTKKSITKPSTSKPVPKRENLTGSKKKQEVEEGEEEEEEGEERPQKGKDLKAVPVKPPVKDLPKKFKEITILSKPAPTPAAAVVGKGVVGGKGVAGKGTVPLLDKKVTENLEKLSLETEGEYEQLATLVAKKVTEKKNTKQTLAWLTSIMKKTTESMSLDDFNVFKASVMVVFNAKQKENTSKKKKSVKNVKNVNAGRSSSGYGDDYDENYDAAEFDFV